MNQWPLSLATLFTSWSWPDIEYQRFAEYQIIVPQSAQYFVPDITVWPLTNQQPSRLLMGSQEVGFYVLSEKKEYKVLSLLSTSILSKSSCQKSKTHLVCATHCNSNLLKIRFRSKVHVHNILCRTCTLLSMKSKQLKKMFVSAIQQVQVQHSGFFFITYVTKNSIQHKRTESKNIVNCDQ